MRLGIFLVISWVLIGLASYFAILAVLGLFLLLIEVTVTFGLNLRRSYQRISHDPELRKYWWAQKHFAIKHVLSHPFSFAPLSLVGLVIGTGWALAQSQVPSLVPIATLAPWQYFAHPETLVSNPNHHPVVWPLVFMTVSIGLLLDWVFVWSREGFSYRIPHLPFEIFSEPKRN